MAKWPSLLDDRVDSVAAEAGRAASLRVVIAILCVIFMALNLGAGAATLWGVVFSIGEAWTWISCRALRRPSRHAVLLRLNFLGSACVVCLTWCLFATLYWHTHSEALRLAGVAALLGVMIHGQCFCYRSPLAFGLMSGPPAVLIIVLPLLLGQFQGLPMVTAIASLTMAVGYMVAAALNQLKSAVALEQAQQDAVTSNRAKDAFLAMMSHELRTPMNGVLGMAHALRQTALSPAQAAHVEMLIGSGDGLMATLNALLDISKIEAGKLELEHSVFDLHELVGSVEGLWRQVARERSLGLEVDIAASAPLWLDGDPTRLSQIINNLVSNALKFTDEGGVRVSVRAQPGARDGYVRLEIRVADDGIGMLSDQQARLFQPFSQADASISRRFGGTGLGLAICRQLAKRMDGDITVASTPGEGSVFTVTLSLPIATAPAGESREDEGPPIAELQVLLVEDNPVNQAVARAILEASGAVVSLASDGVEALERLRVEEFDVVLMDIHMPRMDGIEALRRLRAGEAGRADMWVIAFTADAMSGNDARLLELGFDAVQTKPIQPRALLGALAERQGRSGKSQTNTSNARTGVSSAI
jgi:two-component system, sensor histidine kinase